MKRKQKRAKAKPHTTLARVLATFKTRAEAKAIYEMPKDLKSHSASVDEAFTIGYSTALVLADGATRRALMEII